MFEFDFEQAIKNAEKLAEEKRARRSGGETYVLYYSNTPKQPAGKIIGGTVKSLVTEFRAQGKDKQFMYAVIIRKRDNKEMSKYIRTFSSKFFTGRKRNVNK